MVTTNAISRRRQTSHLKHPKIQSEPGCAINHAVRLIHAVCGLAGSPSLIDEIRAELRADKVRSAIRNRDTGPVFDWLMAAVSYQGISDQVAYGYMEKHGRARWRQIKHGLDCGVRALITARDQPRRRCVEDSEGVFDLRRERRNACPARGFLGAGERCVCCLGADTPHRNPGDRELMYGTQRRRKS
jgi:hypothetical protein